MKLTHVNRTIIPLLATSPLASLMAIAPQRRIRVSGIAISLLLSLTSVPAQAKHFKVFLMGGQSNMFGYGTAPTSLPAALQAPQEDVRFYYGTNYTFLQSGSGGTWGSEITFGRTIADAFPDENFYFIKYADGGTSLWNEWNLINGRSYNSLKQIASFGLDALTRSGHTCEIVGMLWSQGERDAWNLRTTAQYEADFKAFIADIRSRYGADLPFLFTRLSVKQLARPIEAVRLAQELVAASDPNVHMIDADEFGILNDNLHYTAQGYIDMGKDFAQAYLNSLSGDSTAPTPDTPSPSNGITPGIASLSPAHSATGVRFNSKLTVDFTKNISFGSGSITLKQSNGTVVETYDVASPSLNLNLSGSTLTIKPSADLLPTTAYFIEIDATAIDDIDGNSFAGISGDGTWAFTTANAIIAGNLITASASAPSMTNVAFNFGSGTQAWHPYRTIDGTGLSGGEHGTANNTGWLVQKENIQGVSPDIADSYIQWDLGESYPLESIRIWNMNRNGDIGAGIRSVDVYLSNVEFPGDPEGVGAQNWTKLGGATLEFPQSPASGNTGFDLETATSTSLPATEVRTIRFELNTNWNDNNSFTGLSEIQFTAASRGIDSTPPAIAILHPANSATGVNPASDLTITFTEEIALGTGEIRLLQSGGTLVETFDVASPASDLTVSGTMLTLNPSGLLAGSTGCYVEIDATAITDLVGNSFVGISGDGTWGFTTAAADVTAPTIAFQSPRPAATGVNPSTNLIVIFNEPVSFGSGAIHLRKAGGAIVQSFDVAVPSEGLTLSDKSVMLNPSAALDDSTTYYIEIDATAIDDLAGNSFAGLSGASAWSFTTVVPDVTAPDIASTNPANGASFFPADNLFVTFDEWIGFGTGFIHIRESDGTLVESFDVANPGSKLSYLADTVTINPTNDLPLGKSFYVEIESTAIRDNSGNHYPGTVGNTTWNFVVAASVDYTTITHVGTQFDIESGANDPTFGWRNSNPAKPLDIDGDNILGTDGYRTSARTSDPAYSITAIRAPNGNGGGKVYDDPTNPSGNDIGLQALHDANAGNGQETRPLLEFVITQDLPPGTTLRVGVLFDLITVSGGPNTATYTLKQTFGGTATATTPAHEWTGETLDVAYFDLTNVRATHRYVITSTTISTPSHPGPFEQVVGVTFDTGTTGPDETPPGVSALDPANASSDVNPAANLSVTFTEDVVFGTGNITLRQSGGGLVESFDVANPPAGLALNGATVTINPTSDLSLGVTYYVEIEATAIKDLAGNPFAGISGDGTWSFTTVLPVTTPPTVQSLSPANGANNIAPGSDLTVTFDEAIAFGTGSITLRQSGGALVESFDVGIPSAGLSLDGASLIINPTPALSASTTYHVEIDATAIEDLAGNPFAGINGSGTWSFTTAAPGPAGSIVYVGAQMSLEDKVDNPTVGWRNTTPAKPLDIDGDQILGTDGYWLANAQSAPPYATITQGASASIFGWGSVKWDNPANPGGTDTISGAVIRQDGLAVGNTSGVLLQFVITGSDLDGKTLRLGVLNDVIGNDITNGEATYTVEQTAGGTASVTSPAMTYSGASLDAAFFDIAGAEAGDTFVIKTTITKAPDWPTASSFQQFAGLTFDTVANAPGNTFADWADLGTLPGTRTFEGDLNGDGVQDGIAFLLGVANPDNDATGALPVVSEDGNGGLVLTFDCLPVADRGGAALRLAYSSSLSGWAATTDVVPDADGTDAGGFVSYVVDTVSAPPLHRVTATIDSSLASGDKLFGRLVGTE